MLQIQGVIIAANNKYILKFTDDNIKYICLYHCAVNQYDNTIEDTKMIIVNLQRPDHNPCEANIQFRAEEIISEEIVSMEANDINPHDIAIWRYHTINARHPMYENEMDLS